MSEAPRRGLVRWNLGCTWILLFSNLNHDRLVNHLYLVATSITTNYKMVLNWKLAFIGQWWWFEVVSLGLRVYHLLSFMLLVQRVVLSSMDLASKGSGKIALELDHWSHTSRRLLDLKQRFIIRISLPLTQEIVKEFVHYANRLIFVLLWACCKLVYWRVWVMFL